MLRQERGGGAEDGQGEDREVPSRGMGQCFGKSVAAELKTGKAKTAESHRAAWANASQYEEWFRGWEAQPLAFDFDLDSPSS